MDAVVLAQNQLTNKLTLRASDLLPAMMRPFLFFGSLALSCVPVKAEIVLTWPVACEVGKTCEIQHYVDHGSEGGAQDYRCGTVTYRGHNGTDIRLLSMRDEQAGVAVLAAAPGRVLRSRDNMSDVSMRVIGDNAIAGRNCGNGLVVEHADGFETQYCHMARGSLVVKPGDSVVAGQKLGLVGLSGDTEFPHLHLTVRHNGAVIDPFAYGAIEGSCQGGEFLWATALRNQLGYKNGTVLNAGFVDHQIDMATIEAGFAQTGFTPNAPILVAYFQAISLRQGDVQWIVFSGPNGTIQHEAQPLPSNKDQLFLSFGRKQPHGGWPIGTYSARYSVLRDGAPVVERSITTQITAPSDIVHN